MDRPPLTLRAVTYVGSAAAVAGLVHLAVNLVLVRRPRAETSGVEERVSVLLPLRNEAARVEPCLRALLAQEAVPQLEILVLDDESTDSTSDVVRAVAGSQVRLLEGAALRPGWLGKPQACLTLAEQATGDVLVFVDADVVLAPRAVAATVAQLREHDLQLVSPYPRQLADGWLPRLVQPLLQWSWLTFLPLRLAETSPRPSLAAANGQFLAVDAAAHRAVGGHAVVRDAVVEDVHLLKAFKRKGFRGVVTDGSDLASCRMYDSGSELRDGYAKSLWAAFGSPLGAAAVCASLLVAYVIPPTSALLARDRRTRLTGTVGFAAAVGGRVLAARRTHGRSWPDALAHPASVVAFVVLTADSFHRHRNGSLSWKGRPV